MDMQDQLTGPATVVDAGTVVDVKNALHPSLKKLDPK